MDLTGKRVLVVEDEPIVAMMIEDILEEMGAIIVGPASSVAEASALVHDEAIDVALLDVNLSGERSDPVAALLKARGVPVVLATGYGSINAKTASGLAIVHKPYRAEQIAEALTKAIAER